MKRSEPKQGERFFPLYGKRLFDLTLGLPTMVVICPFALMIAILVRVKLGSPILFRQVRPGQNGKTFTLLKFRTMNDACDDRGKPLCDELRITLLGKFLRKTSLDELPELFNVLKGDMSFVGPRPLLPQYMNRYTPEQSRRHEVRPGITGWAQVNGRNAITWEEKFALDVWYVDNRSLLLDLKILAMTVWKVLRGEGISAPNEATMPEFLGSGLRRGDEK